MKKTLLALTLVLSLVLSIAALSVSADGTSYRVALENLTGDNLKYEGKTFFNGPSTSGSAYPDGVGGSMSTPYFNQLNGAQVPFTAVKADGTCGAHRTGLLAFNAPVPAGTYTLSLYVMDQAGIFAGGNSNFAILASFHKSTVTNETLGLDAFNAANTSFVAKIMEIGNAEKDAQATDNNKYSDYTGAKSATGTASGNTVTSTGGKTYVEYTVEVVLTEEVSQLAIWLYQANTLGAAGNVFFNNLTLTPKAAAEGTTAAETTAAPGATSGTTTAPDNGDVASIVALVAVIGTAGVAFAAKKKH